MNWFKNRKQHKGKVFVGVSGGVDSSVSAALLKDQGYDVVGVFIRTWQPDWIECTWRDERRDAMRVCAHLEIPFLELDLEVEYKQGVADYMIAEYKKGRTPNPDVMCNREVKFGGFLNFARKHGAKVATGHYAQTMNPSTDDGSLSLAKRLFSVVNSGNKVFLQRREPILIRGNDIAKDQSYFLWTLTPDQLKDILFPIGHLPKSEVRKLAEKYKLPTATKKDSQGICFIGEIDMKAFLGHYIESVPGDIIDESGAHIGHHQGSLFYTLGERHGFTITKKGPQDLPYYVIAKDIEKNTITVSQSPKNKIQEIVMLDSCIWRTVLDLDKKYSAQIRYHGDIKTVSIKPLSDDRAEVIFDTGEFSLTAGQSVVVYDGNVCCGGGIVH